VGDGLYPSVGPQAVDRLDLSVSSGVADGSHSSAKPQAADEPYPSAQPQAVDWQGSSVKPQAGDGPYPSVGPRRADGPYPSAQPQAFVPLRADPDPQKGGAPQAPGCATHPRPAPAPGAVQSASTFVPALHVTPVATVGAGDAFAAGFLSATLRDLPLRDRLRHGHLWAAAALTAPGDLAAPPSRDHADRLVALDAAAWEKLRLGPGWTQAAEERADEEVRTP
ncbi:PfkB family carbohydrate kinase, partial [Streptomyces regalis]|uniref:PfkB family carbohydrate kinase n=1 Tax=Streptomyces regalis TaxID=68262 RepID=UPI000ABF15BA